jgi:hypothetical protein
MYYTLAYIPFYALLAGCVRKWTHIKDYIYIFLPMFQLVNRWTDFDYSSHECNITNHLHHHHHLQGLSILARSVLKRETSSGLRVTLLYLSKLQTCWKTPNLGGPGFLSRFPSLRQVVHRDWQVLSTIHITPGRGNDQVIPTGTVRPGASSRHGPHSL